MPNPNREHDTSFLSADKTDERVIIHRDLIAHSLRWSHVAKELVALPRNSKPRLLDIGCGVEAPLAKMLYSNRLTNVQYLGIDYGPIKPSMVFPGSFQPEFLERTDAAELLRILGETVDMVQADPTTMHADRMEAVNAVLEPLGGVPTHVACFEVLEHMLPDDVVKLLLALRKVVGPECVLWFSTPVYNSRVGAAGNHINEMTVDTLGHIFEASGFVVDDRWGTFASQRDYLPIMESAYGKDVVDVFNELKQYYDADLVSILWAPLFPDHSRNNLWRLRPDSAYEDPEGEKIFPKMLPHMGPERGSCTRANEWLDAVELLEEYRGH